MLIGISPLLSPKLIKVLMEMGHGDEIVLADAHFPAASHAQRLVRADGHGIVELLKAILALFPLDTYVEHPVALMGVALGDGARTPIWDQYREIVETAAARPDVLEQVERFAFYERARRAYAIVATGETSLYANIILKKGLI